MSKNAPTLRHDSLFASPLGQVGEFRFDQAVADVFPDMLKRSIPGYQSIISQSGLLAARFARPGTRLYDLGSSLGATTLSMHRALLQSNDDKTGSDQGMAGNTSTLGCEIHAIDNSTAMIDTCRAVILAETGHAGLDTHGTPDKQNPLPVYLNCADMLTTPLENASVVAMNFTLQFVDPSQRDQMMKRIADALIPGGVFIMSEKVKFDDPTLNELHIEMYHNYKRANGYSDLEISQKRTALENVLIPDTLETHHKRLDDAGFGSSSVWFQCFNFASIVAIK